MVRYETVEVTQEIMKNMARKRNPRRRLSSGRLAKRATGAEKHYASPLSSSPTSSSSYSSSSELSADEDTGMSAQPSPSPRATDSPVYCLLDNVSDFREEAHDTLDESDFCEPSGAVRALTEVARGLGMDVV